STVAGWDAHGIHGRRCSRLSFTAATRAATSDARCRRRTTPSVAIRSGGRASMARWLQPPSLATRPHLAEAVEEPGRDRRRNTPAHAAILHEHAEREVAAVADEP